MTGLGAIGEFPIGGPPQPISGTWHSTEGTDALAISGGVLGGHWVSTEATDALAMAGHPELAGVWSSAEGTDALAVHGGVLGGAWHSTEGTDALAISGGVLGGHWVSTEATDALAMAGHPELAGVWSSAEGTDALAVHGGVLGGGVAGTWHSYERLDCFTADGLSYDFGEPVYTEKIRIFGWLLDAQGRLNNGDSRPHGGHAPPTCASPQHR